MKKQSKKTYLWGLAIALVVLAGFKIAVSESAPAASEPAADARLTVSETSWNLGDIPMSEGMSTKSVTLTNTSGTPITITNMETSCMCTTVQIVHADGSKSGLKGMPGHGGGSILSETIVDGESVELLVRFDPNAHGPNATGPITRNVQLRTNSLSQPEIDLLFSGNVIR